MNGFFLFLLLIAGMIALCIMPMVIMLLIEALPLIIAVVIGLWVFHALF